MSDRCNHTDDPVFGEVSCTAKILLVLPLNQRDPDLSLIRWVEIQRVNPVVIAAIDKAFERVILLQIKHGFGDENQKSSRAPPVLIILPKPELISKNILQPGSDAPDVLIDDLRSERHRTSVLRADSR